MSSTEKPLDAYLTTLISPAGTPDDHPDPPREVLSVMLAELVKRTQRFAEDIHRDYGPEFGICITCGLMPCGKGVAHCFDIMAIPLSSGQDDLSLYFEGVRRTFKANGVFATAGVYTAFRHARPEVPGYTGPAVRVLVERPLTDQLCDQALLWDAGQGVHTVEELFAPVLADGSLGVWEPQPPTQEFYGLLYPGPAALLVLN